MKTLCLLLGMFSVGVYGIAQRPDDNAPKIASTVTHYLLSAHGEIDGFQLKDETAVRFRAHLSGILANTVRPGDPMCIVVDRIGPTTDEGRGIKEYSVANTKGMDITNPRRTIIAG
jgi:hypothetical protein